MTQELTPWFLKARLNVVIHDRSFVRGVDDDRLFQMDIERDRKTKAERFRIYCGSPDNLVMVTDANDKYQQVLLQVKEPRRTFTQRVWNRQKGDYENRSHTAPEFKRTYLMGMDESHLFIAELPQRSAITNVTSAHRILKPRIVMERERMGKVRRQGEWFFVPLTHDERIELNAIIKYGIQTNARIGQSRNPHIAQYAVKIDHILSEERREGNVTYTKRSEIHEYVKGKVTHSQHRTIKLDDWHRVIENTEVHNAITRRFGWVD